jgi:hypothetical protein
MAASQCDFREDPAGAIAYAEDYARLLGHLLGAVSVTRAGASAECIRPGCNMGLTIDPDHRPAIHGAAVTYTCAAART